MKRFAALLAALSASCAWAAMPECRLKTPEWMSAEFADKCPQAKTLFGGGGPGSAVDYKFPVVGTNSKDMLMYGNQELGVIASFYYDDAELADIASGGIAPDAMQGFWIFHEAGYQEGVPPNILATLEANRMHFSFMPPNPASWFICGEEKEIDFHCEVHQEEADLHTTHEPGILGTPCGESHLCEEDLVCALKKNSLFVTYEAKCKMPEDVNEEEEWILTPEEKAPVGPYENCYYAHPETPCNIRGWMCQRNLNFKDYAMCVQAPEKNAKNVPPLHEDFTSPHRLLMALSNGQFEFENAEPQWQKERRERLKSCFQEEFSELGGIENTEMVNKAAKTCWDLEVMESEHKTEETSGNITTIDLTIFEDEDEEGNEVDGWEEGGVLTNCDHPVAGKYCWQSQAEANEAAHERGLDADTTVDPTLMPAADQRRLHEIRNRRRRLQGLPEISLGSFNEQLQIASEAAPASGGALPAAPPAKKKKKSLVYKCGPKVPITKRAPAKVLSPTIVCSYQLILAPALVLGTAFVMAPLFILAPAMILSPRFYNAPFWVLAVVIFGAPVFTQAPTWTGAPTLFLAPVTHNAPLFGFVPTLVLAPVQFLTPTVAIPDIFEDWVWRRTDFGEVSKVKRYDDYPKFKAKDAKIDIRSTITFFYADVFPVRETIVTVGSQDLPTIPIPDKVLGTVGIRKNIKLRSFYLVPNAPTVICPRWVLADPTGGPVPRVQVIQIIPYDLFNGKVFDPHCTIPYPSDVIRDIPHMPKSALKAIQVLEAMENLIPKEIKIAGLQALSLGEVLGEGQIPDFELWLEEWQEQLSYSGEYKNDADGARRLMEEASKKNGTGKYVTDDIFAWNRAATKASDGMSDEQGMKLPGFFDGSKNLELAKMMDISDLLSGKGFFDDLPDLGDMMKFDFSDIFSGMKK